MLKSSWSSDVSRKNRGRSSYQSLDYRVLGLPPDPPSLPLCASDFLFSSRKLGRGVRRSSAIDHCRESHAFAQVSIQGSFPPLRCTNPPVHTRIIAVRVQCAHQLGNTSTHHVEARWDSRNKRYRASSREQIDTDDRLVRFTRRSKINLKSQMFR